MSLNRLLLRALTINALSQQEYDATPPTIAGDRIFDSRVDPINFEEDHIEVPIIAVYTDTDFATLRDRGAGIGAFERKVDLRIDFAIASFMKTIVDEETSITYGVPSTDGEMEAVLDLFEMQIWRALMTPGRKASLEWTGMIKSIETWTSRVERDSEGNNRLAARGLELRVEIQQDCYPSWRRDDEERSCVSIEDIVGKVPWLGPLVDVISLDTSYSHLLDILRDAAGGASVVLPHLSRLGSMHHTALGPEQTVLTALLAGKVPPRGVTHTKQIWSFK